MIRMKTTRTRVTVSLPADLVQLIDRCTRELKETRSGLVEDWLRRASRQYRQRVLDDEITEYYGSRSDAERDEDDAIARTAGLRAAELSFDEAPVRRKRR